MKMKKYMAMGLGAIMAVGIAVSGVLPVSAVNNNENDAKLATAVTMSARDYDDYEGIIKSNTTLRSKATSNSRKITTLKKGAVVEVVSDASTETVLYADMPIKVQMKVTYTEPGLKGDTATNTLNPATVESGATVRVPLFISEGETIEIDTRDGSYVGRVKA